LQTEFASATQTDLAIPNGGLSSSVNGWSRP